MLNRVVKVKKGDTQVALIWFYTEKECYKCDVFFESFFFFFEEVEMICTICPINV